MTFNTYLSNAFSLSMLTENASLEVQGLTDEEARQECFGIDHDIGDPYLIPHSFVGHKDLATLIGAKLYGIDVPVRRESLTLVPGDVLIVAQYVGPRLPEGTTTLPEGAKIEWRKVVVKHTGEREKLLNEISKLKNKLYEILGEEGCEDI